MKKTPPTKRHRWISTYSEYEWVEDRLVLVKEDGYWYEGPMALAHDTPNSIQDAHRFYNSSGTALSTQDEDPYTLDVDTAYQVCFRIENSAPFGGDGGEPNSAYDLEYNLNGGGWNSVTTTAAPIQAVAAGLTQDATYTTDRLTGATGTANTHYESTSGTTAIIILEAGTYREFVFGFQIPADQVANNDTIDIRVTRNGTTMDTYTVQYPTITVNESAGPTPQNVNGSAGTTATITKSVNKTVTDAVGTSATRTNTVILNDFDAVGTVAAVITIANYLRTLSSAAATVGSITQIAGKTLTDVVGTTATRANEVLKSLSDSVATAATRANEVFKSLSDAVATSSTLDALKAVFQTVSASVGTSAQRALQAFKSLTDVVGSTPTLTKLASFARTIGSSVSTAPQLLRELFVTLADQVPSSATLTSILSKTLSSTVATASTLSKLVSKLLSDAVATAVTLLTGSDQILNAVVGTASSMTKQVTKLLNDAAATVATRLRTIYKSVSLGSGFGPELVQNGTFDTASNWTTSGDWAISGGSAGVVGGLTTGQIQQTGIAVSNGTQYTLSIDMATISGTTVTASIGGMTPLVLTPSATSTRTFTSNGSGTLTIADSGGFLFVVNNVDNVSLKEVVAGGVGTTPSLALAFARTIAAIVGTTAVLSRLAAFIRVLSGTIATTALLIPGTQQVLSFAVSTVGTVEKAFIKVLTATISSIATRLRQLFRNIIATSATVAVVSKSGVIADLFVVPIKKESLEYTITLSPGK